MTEIPSAQAPVGAPRQALARRLLWHIAAAMSLAILALTTFVYWHTYRQTENQLRASIERVNQARADSESAAFSLAEDRLLLVREAMRSQTFELPGDGGDFERWWLRGSDGLWRIRRDHPGVAGALSGALVSDSPEVRAWAMAVVRTLIRLGPSLSGDYLDLYCIRQGDASVTFSARADYTSAEKAADFKPGGMLYSLPAQSMAELRALPVRWTRIYEDPFIRQWMLSAATQIEEHNERVTYCAIDLSMAEILKRSINPTLPGSFNIILNRYDELLVHPELATKIQEAGGNLNLHNLGDPLLLDIDAMSKQESGGQARYTQDGDYLVALSHFDGPDWRFATLYPARLIRAEALVPARATLIAGLATLVLSLISLAVIIRRNVARPLGRLMRATEQAAEGAPLALPESRFDDEIARLAQAMRHMAGNLLERDRHLMRHAIRLEQEVSERKHREEALRQVTEKLTLATKAAYIGVWDYDLKTRTLEWDEQMFEMYGLPPGEKSIALRQWRERVHPDDLPKVVAWLKAGAEGRARSGEQEFRVVWPDGTVRHINTYGQMSVDADGRPARLTGVNVDITERKLQEARIVHMATHDALTGLPNRSLLQDRIVQAIAGAERLNQHVAVMFIDLDRFKTINDSLGHGRGDELLMEAGERLYRVLRKADTLGRLGGDEFVVVLPFIHGLADAEAGAEKILQAFVEPFLIAGQSLTITTSIGISLYPSDGQNPETLIRNADTAMYRAKARGRNTWQAYSAEMSEQANELLKLENDLRLALERDELQLVYQPKHRLDDSALVGAEALLRWHRPGHGIVAPDRFIPVAEERGLIDAISAWVLRASLKQQRQWRDAGLSPVPVAINLDAKQFSRPDLPQAIETLLREFQLTPDLLQLELTESALLRDEYLVLENLRRLRAMGVLIAVDDFGTGYSSLSYLHRFPLDVLKIVPLSTASTAGIPPWSAPSSASVIPWVCRWWPRAWKMSCNWSSCVATAAMRSRAICSVRHCRPRIFPGAWAASSRLCPRTPSGPNPARQAPAAGVSSRP